MTAPGYSRAAGIAVVLAAVAGAAAESKGHDAVAGCDDEECEACG